MPDLWPDDFGQEDVTPPITILREQAEALARRTKGMVTASVHTRKAKEVIVHEFMLEVPTLDNYSYELFWAQHDVFLYPAKIVLGQEEAYDAADAEAFKGHLRSVLALPT